MCDVDWWGWMYVVDFGGALLLNTLFRSGVDKTNDVVV